MKQVAEFDKISRHTTSYSSAAVNTALSCSVFDLFDIEVKNIITLKFRLGSLALIGSGTIR